LKYRRTPQLDVCVWRCTGMAYLLSQEERLGSQGRFHHRNKRREYQSSPTYDA
jgi:hypothetical protein